MTNALNITGEGLQVFDSTTGVFTAVDLTTKGDVLTRNASVYTRLGIGSDGQFLTSNSAAATGLSWAAVVSGSAYILLSAQTAATSSSIDFTSVIDNNTYCCYLLTYRDVHPSSDGVEARLLASTNNGSSYLSSSYRWSSLYYDATAGSSSSVVDDSDSDWRIGDDIGNAAGEGISGELFYFPSSNISSYGPQSILFDSTQVEDNGRMDRVTGSGFNTTSSQINALRFLFSSGTIIVGDFAFYGIKKS